MRFRKFLPLLTALLLAFSGAALADTVTYNGIQYIFPGETEGAAYLTLSVSAEFVDPRTLETESVSALAGAVFGVYAKSADGALVAYPDPRDPARPLVIETTARPVSVALPRSAELYLCQLSAPEGYALALTEPLRVEAPCELTLSCRGLSETGVRVLLRGDTANGPAPLAGARFTLENGSASYQAETDADGVALFTGVAPGEYTLTQSGAPAPYTIDEPSRAATVSAGEIARVEITDSLPGRVTLSVRGLSADRRTGQTRLVPLERAYDLFDASGARVATLQNGESIEVTAAQDGARYTLCAAGGAEDGFAADTAVHELLVFSGAECPAQALVTSEAGFVDVAQIDSATGLPVAGGELVLYDASGAEALRLAVGADGRYTGDTPLAAGEYTLAMRCAAEGYVYTDARATVTVKPYLPEKQAVEATFASDALPAAVTAPRVTCDAASLPSLFDGDAEIPVALRVEGLPEGVRAAFAAELPALAGVSGEIAADGAGAVHAARRFNLSGAEEIGALTVRGTVSFVYEYVVDNQGGKETKAVSAPFEVEIATFAAAQPVRYAVSGYLTDANGAPLAGREVSLLDENGNALETVETDPLGAYAFAGEGRVSVRADEGFGVRYTENGAQMLPLQTRRVRVEGGEAVRGAALTVRCGEDARAACAGDALVFECLPGTEIEIELPEGYLSKTRTESGETIFAVYRAASLRGRVCEPDGTPLAGARVTYGAQRCETGADGAFAFENLFPEETETLRLAPPAGYLVCGAEAEQIALADGETREITLTAMRPARVEGVLTEEGKPLAGMRVRLNEVETETDEKGRFAFDGLVLGEYALAFETPDGMAIEGAPEEIEIARSGETVSLALYAIRAASVRGEVWHDEDNNGLRSANEAGVSGAEVTLLDASGAPLAAVTTKADGAFAFDGLLPGEYRIAVTLPEHMIFSREAEGMRRLIAGQDDRAGESAAFTLASGEEKTRLLCGAVLSGRIEGVVWEDANGDGAMDGAEAPLANVTVALEQNGETVRTAVTGADGRYAFEHLRSGDYIVRAAQDGMLATTGEPAAMAVRTWKTDFEANLGFVRPAEITAALFADESADGVRQAGEPALPGVTVALVDAKGKETASAESDADGVVRFSAVYPGEYRLRAVCPDGWTATLEPDAIAAASGEKLDAGRIGLTKLGGVSGVVFADADYDGLRGETEAAVSAAVTLLDGEGNALAQTRTDASGAYAFSGLKAGKYIVSFRLPEGWQFTRERADAPSYNSDVPETAANEARTAQLYLPMGETLLVDAGGYRAAKLSGEVWLSPDGGEKLTGVRVLLTRGGETVLETETDARGAYAFDALPPGEYAVEPQLPDGLLVRSEEMESVTLTMGESRGNVRFAAVRAAKLTGAIAGANAFVTLQGPDGANWECSEVGAFTFDGLLPGEYTLQVAPEAGFALTEWRQETQTFALAPGETREFAFAAQPEATAAGAVWYDENGDNRSEGEAPLADVQVTLNRLEDGETIALRTARTDERGAFRFTALAPGEYALAFTAEDGEVRFAQPAAFTLAEGGAWEKAVAAWRPAEVSGFVWDDKNADGLRRRTETPLEGITVELLSADGDVISETATDADGAYAFAGLRPGEMRVRFTLDGGCVFTDYNEKGSIIRQTDSNVGETDLFALRAGEVRADVSAGSLTAGRVGDRVWVDENGNGLQDSGESGLENVTVILIRVAADYSESECRRTVTDAAGRYRFDFVRPGTYRVQFELPAGYAPTVSMPDYPAINSKLETDTRRPGFTATFQVRSGEAQLAVDAGVVEE